MNASNIVYVTRYQLTPNIGRFKDSMKVNGRYLKWRNKCGTVSPSGGSLGTLQNCNCKKRNDSGENYQIDIYVAVTATIIYPTCCLE